MVAVHQSGKGYKESLNDLQVHYSTVRKIIHKLKTHKKVSNLPKSGGSSQFTARSDHVTPKEM